MALARRYCVGVAAILYVYDPRRRCTFEYVSGEIKHGVAMAAKDARHVLVANCRLTQATGVQSPRCVSTAEGRELAEEGRAVGVVRVERGRVGHHRHRWDAVDEDFGLLVEALVIHCGGAQ